MIHKDMKSKNIPHEMKATLLSNNTENDVHKKTHQYILLMKPNLRI
jgi:hypothetical protein